MKRLVLCVVLTVLALSGVVAGPVRAQEGPQGTWLGTWPYTAPGTHHLNSFSTGGLNENLGIVYRPLVELQMAFYLWASNEYVPIFWPKAGAL